MRNHYLSMFVGLQKSSIKNYENHNEMSKLFVLINCVSGEIGSTIDKIRKIKPVIDIQQIDGQYDLIVTLESKSIHELKKVLMYQIRTIDTIGCTLTLHSNLDMVVE